MTLPKKNKKKSKINNYIILSFVIVAIVATGFLLFVNLFSIKKIEFGNYIFEKYVFMTPSSSFTPNENFKEYFSITEENFIIISGEGLRNVFGTTFGNASRVNLSELQDPFTQWGMEVPDLSSYKKISKQTIFINQNVEYRIYFLDDLIWLMQLNSSTEVEKFPWSIVQITKYDEAIPTEPPIEVIQEIQNFEELSTSYLLDVPEQIIDPDTSFGDFFASIEKINWNVQSKGEETDPINGNIYLTVTYDLGNNTLFYTRLFQESEQSFIVKQWNFITPDEEVSGFLIERAIEAINANEISAANQEGKAKFREDAIEYISKLGDNAFNYIINAFNDPEIDTGRALILAQMGSRVLGPRDNVPQGWTEGVDWYNQVNPHQTITLETFNLDLISSDQYEVLASKAIAFIQSQWSYNPIAVVNIHHVQEQNDKLTLWISGYYQSFELFGPVLSSSVGGEVRARIEFSKKNGQYSHESAIVTQATDGAYASSIKEFTSSVSGLYEEIMNYEWYTELHTKMIEALKIQLREMGLTGISWNDLSGEYIPLT